MTQSLHFSISGEFVTNAAREVFYTKHDLNAAIDIIQSATMTDQLTEDEHTLLCLDIIAGKKNIVGIYPGDDYGIENVDPDNKINAITVIADELKAVYDEKIKLSHELRNMMQKFLFVCNNLDEYKLKRLNQEYKNEYDKLMFENLGIPNYSNTTLMAINEYNKSTPAIDSYIEHAKNYRDDDYGWLEPNGTYHAVEWGEHSSWAREYIEEHYPYRTHADMYWKTDTNGQKCHYVNGDFLVYCLHWVLLDSPYQGVATPKFDASFGMTKAQKEFLYDYYIERNMHDKANEIWKDEV